MISKKSQVWVETVIYTLIGLSIIGILLAVITPKINDIKDKAIITENINSLNEINQQVQNTLLSPGNKRQITLPVKKGEYVIDSVNDTIYYVMRDTNYMYSQVGQEQTSGDLTRLTIQKNGDYDVYLILNYKNFNITYQDKDVNRILTAAPTPYVLLIENRGAAGGMTKINIEPK